NCRMKELLLLSVLFTVVDAEKYQFPSARAILFKASAEGDGNPGEVVGTVDFWQQDGKVTLNGSVRGLAPNQKHGFHVHQFGDITKGCANAGGHYNPKTKDHGAQDAPIRHYGDLGNIVAPANGIVDISNSDTYLSLNGPYSIIGRALVVHEKEDDLGLGGDEASKQNGNAGARVACGVIAIMEDNGNSVSLLSVSSSILLTLAYLFMH
ncbi:hypothetical protein PMAYCL1PPCAC_00430, partial [Pristionchus mayeri]